MVEHSDFGLGCFDQKSSAKMVFGLGHFNQKSPAVFCKPKLNRGGNILFGG
jgi:hypothetical protein